jgi:2-polyprenyl-3-methyl-5-hydroxy-6-metoxy-1,4-benzoquinol methylase
VSVAQQERRTEELFGDIHSLPDGDYVQTSRDRVLTAAHLDVPENFLNGKSALDAGTGGRGRALAGLYRMGARDIVAIDLSETNIRNAQRDNSDLDSFVTYQTANLLDLPFEPERFDFIHCSGVAHHTADPDRAVAEMYRCLKPGGQLYISLYGRGGLLYTTATIGRRLGRLVPYSVAKSVGLWTLGGAVTSNLLDYVYVPYQFHYTEAMARQLLHSAGLTSARRLEQPAELGNGWWDQLLKPSTYDPKTTMGKLMVGSGWIVLVAEKP